MRVCGNLRSRFTHPKINLNLFCKRTTYSTQFHSYCSSQVPEQVVPNSQNEKSAGGGFKKNKKIPNYIKESKYLSPKFIEKVLQWNYFENQEIQSSEASLTSVIKIFKENKNYELKESGEFLFGINSIISAIARSNRSCFAILTNTDLASSSKTAIIKEIADAKNIPIFYTNAATIYELSLETNRHQNTILYCSSFKGKSSNLLGTYNSEISFSLPRDYASLLPPFRFSFDSLSSENLNFLSGRNFPVFLALENIYDVQNIGSILRTAWHFGVDGVILDKNIISPACVNVSTGATEIMPIYFCGNMKKLIKISKENGWTTVATVSHAFLLENQDKSDKIFHVDKGSLSISAPTIILMGNESTGLSDDAIDSSSILLSIPRSHSPTLDYPTEFSISHEDNLSLNVSVATGVILQKIFAATTRQTSK